MLVLSRGQNDKVVFPALGISVEILRISGHKVRIGIDAPKDVSVVREELLDRDASDSRSVKINSDKLTHSVRNRLQQATLGLRLLQKMFDLGRAADAEPIIFRIFNELKSLEQELGGDGEVAASTVATRGVSRALVVEDNPQESELLAGYLRLSGFEVATAGDGLQAMVQLAQPLRPDVVLLDMKMPRFDGPKTVAAIRENPDYQALRIFAVTGTDRGDTALELGPAGVNRWFRKPIDPEQLVHAIQEDLAIELLGA